MSSGEPVSCLHRLRECPRLAEGLSGPVLGHFDPAFEGREVAAEPLDLGRQIDVAASCGLGRRTRKAAQLNLERTDNLFSAQIRG